jgi:hypothetical protein
VSFPACLAARIPKGMESAEPITSAARDSSNVLGNLEIYVSHTLIPDTSDTPKAPWTRLKHILAVSVDQRLI